MYTTRYGRVVKKPVTYTPEPVEFEDDDSGSDVSSDVSSEISYESDELTSESDADECTGNLKDFVVESDAEDDEKNSVHSEQNGSSDQSGSKTDDTGTTSH